MSTFSHDSQDSFPLLNSHFPIISSHLIAVNEPYNKPQKLFYEARICRFACLIFTVYANINQGLTIEENLEFYKR